MNTVNVKGKEIELTETQMQEAQALSDIMFSMDGAVIMKAVELYDERFKKLELLANKVMRGQAKTQEPQYVDLDSSCGD